MNGSIKHASRHSSGNFSAPRLIVFLLGGSPANSLTISVDINRNIMGTKRVEKYILTRKSEATSIIFSPTCVFFRKEQSNHLLRKARLRRESNYRGSSRFVNLSIPVCFVVKITQAILNLQQIRVPMLKFCRC